MLINKKKNGRIWVSLEAQRVTDVKPLVGVAAELRNLGFLVSFHSGKMGELKMRQWLGKYQPDVLVVRGISWGHRLRESFRFSGHSSYKPLIVVIPGEYTYSVFPPSIKQKLYAAPTFETAGDHVDLVLTIHSKERRFILDIWPTIEHRRVKIVGLPAFDPLVRYSKSPGEKKLSRQNEHFGNSRGVYTVIIASRSATSNYGKKDARERMAKRAKTYYGTKEKYTQQQITFHIALSKEYVTSTKELAKKYPNISFLFKPHPAESVHAYIKEFKGIHNIDVIDSSKASLLDVIQSADLLIGYRCGSFVEAFLNTIPSVNYMPSLSEGLEKLEGPSNFHPKAYDNLPKWTVYSRRDLIQLLEQISMGVTERKFRTKFSNEGLDIHEVVGEIDGQASTRAARSIVEYVKDNEQSIETCWRGSSRQKQHISRAANRSILSGVFQPYRLTKSPVKWFWNETKNQLKLLKRSRSAQAASHCLGVDVEKEIAVWSSTEISTNLVDEMSVRLRSQSEVYANGYVDGEEFV